MIMSPLMYDATGCHEAISMMTSLDVCLAKQCFAAIIHGFSEIQKKDPSVHSSTAFLVASQTALPPSGH